MEIKLANKENISQLYDLWQICFGDDKETIDMFFNNSFECENTIVCVDDEKVVAMMFLLPEVIKICEKEYLPTYSVTNKEYSAYYLYALGTTPEYRQRGIMGEMIEYAARLSKDRQIDYLFLVPASESLFGYYEKRGFQNAFRQKKLVMDKKGLKHLSATEGLNLVSLDSTSFRKMKNDNLENQNFVDWNESEINLASDYFRSGNGEVVATEKGTCFIEHAKNRDIVYDLTVKTEDLCSMLNTINNHIISDEIEFHLSENYALISDSQEYYDCGMVRMLNENLDDLSHTYMGITLQ